jgi:hypothetical protein
MADGTQKFDEQAYNDFQFQLKRATNLDLYKQLTYTARHGVQGLMAGTVLGVVVFWCCWGKKSIFWGALVGGVTGGLFEVAIMKIKGGGDEQKEPG